MFGNTATAGSTGFGGSGGAGAFGGPTANNNAFGSNAATTGGFSFGQPKPAFGAASGSGLFGSSSGTTAASGFGNPQSNPFGQAGAGTALGQGVPPSEGTISVPFNTTNEKDPSGTGTNSFQSINFMPAYSKYSFEVSRLFVRSSFTNKSFRNFARPITTRVENLGMVVASQEHLVKTLTSEREVPSEDNLPLHLVALEPAIPLAAQVQAETALDKALLLRSVQGACSAAPSLRLAAFSVDNQVPPLQEVCSDLHKAQEQALEAQERPWARLQAIQTLSVRVKHNPSPPFSVVVVVELVEQATLEVGYSAVQVDLGQTSQHKTQTPLVAPASKINKANRVKIKPKPEVCLEVEVLAPRKRHSHSQLAAYLAQLSLPRAVEASSVAVP